MSFLFFIIIILANFSLSAIHAQEPQTPTDTLMLKELSCSAYDPASLKYCLEQVALTGLPLIKVTATITCHNRQECGFRLKDINSNVTISGSKPEAKIVRQDDYSYPLLAIETSSRITFSDMGFEDGNGTNCLPGTICSPLITLSNSSDITFSKVNFLNGRAAYIKSNDSRRLSIINSSFKDSFRTAIEIASRIYTEGNRIENNVFDGNASSAIVFQAASLKENPSSIRGNNFVNNHSKGSYLNCTYPCTGSQLRILGPTSNLAIADNKIFGGADTIYDAVGLYSSGIEIGNQNIVDILLSCNEIAGNRGSGIVQSPPFKNLGRINIAENKIWNNGLNLNVPIATIDTSNCYTQSCKLACSSR